MNTSFYWTLFLFQLRHQFTNKYIHVSTTKTSDTESNNMAVNMIIQKLIAFDFFPADFNHIETILFKLITGGAEGRKF